MTSERTTVEKLVSRLFAIKKGIISPKYALTEAMIKKYRPKKKGGKINKK